MEITQQRFDDELEDLLSEYRGDELLSITGIYEILAERFNNEVLERLED